MGSFTKQPIREGSGDVHLNYFRTFIRPRPGARSPSRADRIAGMPDFMDKRSAQVGRDSHRWNGYPTLIFRGVAKVRAVFGFPSENVRRWITPQIHTDSVGFVTPPCGAFVHRRNVEARLSLVRRYPDPQHPRRSRRRRHAGRSGLAVSSARLCAGHRDHQQA